mmetsp:Transcript_13812/g.20223  ORF Transcript_13812/g.20223 Transcript_13812/m.20223 type:complete len:123 (-) Transcript_13812:110-478(-)|eukprot:CAMPEP_0194046948 /NCGR_PEP_ID=MMETSP0009_2-20130614/23100_1 /TAXON_ID=210454 /ORGANISM="Grammatophora oceanica, Strain CCMP 410" /LENGTH=122 /DNA_ID=CAMNT_0038692429 /DNA_START=128 /DNA_END=496 /DNA_ORIENTATION=-
MSFWGSSKKPPSPPTETSFSSGDESYNVGTDFSAAPSSAPTSGLADMQQFSLALRQQIMVQTVITDLSDTAFAQCITGKPSDSLSGKESACIHATVNKWMDTNEFMMGRLAKKQQQAAGSAF